MQFEYKLIRNVPVITFMYDEGNLLSGDVQAFGKEIMSHFDGDSDRIVFDLRNIVYFNSFAVGELVGIRNYLLEKGLDSVLIMDSSNIVKLFDMLGIMDIFQIISSENEI